MTAKSDAAGCRFCDTPLPITFVDPGISRLCQTNLEVSERTGAEAFYPLPVFVCDNCLLVDVEKYVSPETIFSEYAYFSFVDTLVREADRSHVRDWGGQSVVPIPDAKVLS